MAWLDAPFLGASAYRAFLPGAGMETAMMLFETATGLGPDDEGCPCCGSPHYFYEGDSDELG